MITTLKPYDLNDVISNMQRMSSEGVQDAQVQMLTSVALMAGKTDNPIESIFDFVLVNYRYGPEEGEVLWHPRVLAGDYFLYPDPFSRSAIDCDDFAMLTATMLKLCGVDAHMILADTDGDGQVDHAYAEANTGLGWLSVDTSSKTLPLGWYINGGRMVI